MQSEPPTLIQLFEKAEPIPLVSGSMGSLDGLKPGDQVLLDLSGYDLAGERIQDVKPPLCVVGGRIGALYVDTSDKSAWTESQVWAYRELDAIEEALDFVAFEPNGHPHAGPSGLARLAREEEKRKQEARAKATKDRANQRARERAKREGPQWAVRQEADWVACEQASSGGEGAAS